MMHKSSMLFSSNGLRSRADSRDTPGMHQGCISERAARQILPTAVRHRVLLTRLALAWIALKVCSFRPSFYYIAIVWWMYLL